MIERYRHPNIEAIFSDTHRWTLWSRVEKVYFRARLSENDPALTRKMVARLSDVGLPHRELIAIYEGKLGHDVVAFLAAWSATIDDDAIAAQLHLGLTSSDLVDNALFAQLNEVRESVMRGLGELVRLLEDLSDRHADSRRIGRTHGQVAEPTTFGWRFEVWMRTASLLHQQGYDLQSVVNVFKSPGAVGNMRLLGKAVANRAAASWGAPLLPSTQVIPRQRMVLWAAWLVAIVSLAEEIAMEVRLSSRSEVREMFEGRAEDRVGSSAMPHKRNPIAAERLSGLGRVARSMFAPIAETAGNLHNERDISNSSVERVVVPDLSHLVAFALAELLDLLTNLDINTTKANNMAGTVMDSALVQFNLQRLGVPYMIANEEARHQTAVGGWDYDRIIPIVNKYQPEELDVKAFLQAMGEWPKAD